MRTSILFLTAFLGAASVPFASRAAGNCPSAPVKGLSLPASRDALRAGEPLKVVAFGSSSTEGAGASTPAHTYPARLETLLRAALPDRAVSVENRGIGGQDVGEMLARLDRDVLAERPHLVVWQAGANAALRGMKPEAFSRLLAEGIARVRASGADLVLMDSQLAPVVLSRPLYPQLAAAMRDTAAAHAVPVFSRTALMRAWEASGVSPLDMLHADGLHHNDRGYACLAEALAGSILAGLRTPEPVVAGRR